MEDSLNYQEMEQDNAQAEVDHRAPDVNIGQESDDKMAPSQPCTPAEPLPLNEIKIEVLSMDDIEIMLKLEDGIEDRMEDEMEDGMEDEIGDMQPLINSVQQLLSDSKNRIEFVSQSLSDMQMVHDTLTSLEDFLIKYDANKENISSDSPAYVFVQELQRKIL